MGDIIEFKPREPSNDDKWRFSLDIYEDKNGGGWRSTVTDFNPDDGLEVGERLRDIASSLEAVAFLARQQAEDIDPSEDGAALATVIIFNSSKVRVRVNDEEIVSDEQKAWIIERFNDAKVAAFPDHFELNKG